jgi:preprotein translocase subunit SecA
MAAKVRQWGPDVMRYVEKTILLQMIDHLWRQHVVMLENLNRTVRGRGQRDALQDYSVEAFNLFEAMTAQLREAVTAQLMRVEIVSPEAPAARAAADGSAQMPEPAARGQRDPKNPASWGKVDRNEECPCGTGKKYKHCHGRSV